MINFIYGILEKIHYTHPLHPPWTHLPIGLVGGAFIFGLVALLLRRNILSSIAYHRIILLAFIFIFPAIFFGYTDWQRYYFGDWLFPIKIKIVLSGVLFILLLIAFLYGRKAGGETKGALVIYALCLATVTGLGYYGAQLSFAEKPPTASKVIFHFRAGEKLYSADCKACHPRGADIASGPAVEQFDTFLAFLRNPNRPGGSPTGMPPFPPDQLSNEQALHLYHYIIILLSTQSSKAAAK